MLCGTFATRELSHCDRLVLGDVLRRVSAHLRLSIRPHCGSSPSDWTEPFLLVRSAFELFVAVVQALILDIACLQRN